MPAKILITGANGFIGKNVLDCLTSSEFEIYAVSRQKKESNKVFWHSVDLLDVSQITQLVRSIRPDYLMHLAWDTTPGLYLENPENLNWVASTLNLCREFYSSGGKRALFAGTCFEQFATTSMLESSQMRDQNTLYATSKLGLSKILSKFCEDEKLSFAWARIFYLYGMYENERRVIPYIIKSLLEGKQAICSDSSAKKDYSFASDTARALLHILHLSQNGIFDIGSGIALPIREIFILTAKLVGRPELLVLRGPVSDEMDVLVADVSRLMDIGFFHEHTLERGLLKTIDWWKERLNVGV